MIADRIRSVRVDDRVDEMILTQYKNSTNLIAYIKAFVSPIQSIFSSSADSINSRCIDKASGHSLDKIAKTVGEFRVINGASASPYFGFHEHPTALGLSEGLFYSYGDKVTENLVLSDSQLRSFIRARIIKNTSGGKVNDILKYFDYIVEGSMLGETLNTRLYQGNLSIRAQFDNYLTRDAKLMLSIRAKDIIPIGISFSMADLDGEIEVIQ